MEYTTVTVRRGNGPINSQTPIASNVQVQIDSANTDMANFDGGASPYDWYNIYVLAGSPDVDVRRNDHLIADSNNAVYTVSNSPEKFLDGHIEITAFVPVGS